jgi:hypothetical protein
MKRDLLRYYKSLFESLEISLFAKFCQFPCSWIQIRIRVPSVDPDPEAPNQCVSGSTTLHFMLGNHQRLSIFQSSIFNKKNLIFPAQISVCPPPPPPTSHLVFVRF